MLEYLILRTAYPCCQRHARIKALVQLPRERYTKRCLPCETTWDVTRATSLRGTVRVDRLDWTDTKDRTYQRQYGR